METLSDEIWDVVIAGTSIPQSLLALSLSRSGKKVLHVDRHDYYGGEDAGLSLQDASKWVQELSEGRSRVFSDASIVTAQVDLGNASGGRLATSRSYTLSLNPQIIFAQSSFLPMLVASRIHSQLEFLAVGSWWIQRERNLQRVPSTREDVFNDESLSMKDKRSLMKFLRYVLQDDDEQAMQIPQDSQLSLNAALSEKFKIPDILQAPLQALALSPLSADSIPFNVALSRIRRHMRSMGYFGPGFGAVIPKYGGNSEISQVACRAGAVGGGVYLLGHELKEYSSSTKNPAASVKDAAEEYSLIESVLSNGTHVRSKVIVGTADELPIPDEGTIDNTSSNHVWRSISVVADPLRHLFPQTSDNGPTPAVAIVMVDSGSTMPPVYLQVHSEDTGECPPGQCIIYASLASPQLSGKARLLPTVADFVANCGAEDSVLWTLVYGASVPVHTSGIEQSLVDEISPRVFAFAPRPQDLSFPDTVLSSVKEVWATILGSDAEGGDFLRFEERDTEGEID